MTGTGRGSLAPAPTARAAPPRRGLRAALLPLAWAALGLLGGCAPAGEDLDAWTQQQRLALKPSLPPLAEPPRFEPLAYTGARQDDPFDPRRVAPPEAAKPTPPAGGGARAGGALLTRPLEDMRMVGTLRGGAGARALVRVDGQVHAVAPGDVLGPNRGRIVRIDEQRIELRETVLTANGQWTERPATLQMQGDTP
jgi:type IV pilus assembly protein PilP